MFIGKDEILKAANQRRWKQMRAKTVDFSTRINSVVTEISRIFRDMVRENITMGEDYERLMAILDEKIDSEP